MREAKLYVVPASHPCATVIKALELKGVPYRRIDLVPAFHAVAQRLRFSDRTVPGIVFADGTKVQGSRAILRHLDFPGAGSEAERWGDETLQPLVRRVVWEALSKHTRDQLSYMEGAKLVPPTPKPVAKAAGGAVAWIERRLNRSTPDAVRRDLEAFPGHLDRIDAWIADGTLGGEEAADLQIGASVRLLHTLDDLKPLIDGRPAGELALRLFPVYPGRVSAGALPSS